MSLKDIHEALRNSYPEPNYLMLKEVRDATGFDAVRSADAIAIGLYRSCGRLIHGFECKISRSDWLKELKNAAKAESLMRYCHRWALIVPDESIVQDGELPAGWGLGVPSRKRANAALRIRWVIPPPELQPISFSMVFLTALLAAAQKPDKKAQEKAIAEERAAAYERGRASKAGGSAEEFVKLRDAVRAFEHASGIHVSEYTAPADVAQKGKHFREWLNARGSVECFVQDMKRAHRNGEYAVERLRKQIDEIENPATSLGDRRFG